MIEPALIKHAEKKMRKLISVLTLLGSFCSYAVAEGNLEIPAGGSTVSGIDCIHKWLASLCWQPILDNSNFE